MSETAAALVDVAFPLSGRTVPREHRNLLAHALERELPWLRTTPRAGMHRIKAVDGEGDVALLPQRARLMVRVPRAQVAALDELAGREIRLGAHRLQLGAPAPRELLAHRTLYAEIVVAAEGDELAFLAAVESELRALEVSCRCICGRAQAIEGDAYSLSGFSLMLDGLSPADSLRVLENGIGAHRRLGCGLFVPHRSAAAVGT